MTLAGWSPHKMPLQVPQQPIITEKKNGGGVTTPAPLAVPDQYATVGTNPITGELNELGVVAASTNRFRTRSPALCWMPSSRVGLTTKPGALRGGRETFVTMRLSEPMTFDGVDGSQGPHGFLPGRAQLSLSSKFRFRKPVI
jgi:hypothetical protein